MGKWAFLVFIVAITATILTCLEPFGLWAIWHWVVRPESIKDAPTHGPTPGAGPFFISSALLMLVSIAVDMALWYGVDSCMKQWEEELKAVAEKKQTCPICDPKAQP